LFKELFETYFIRFLVRGADFYETHGISIGIKMLFIVSSLDVTAVQSGVEILQTLLA
jgi:hypothetical protein